MKQYIQDITMGPHSVLDRGAQGSSSSMCVPWIASGCWLRDILSDSRSYSSRNCLKWMWWAKCGGISSNAGDRIKQVLGGVTQTGVITLKETKVEVDVVWTGLAGIQYWKEVWNGGTIYIRAGDTEIEAMGIDHTKGKERIMTWRGCFASYEIWCRWVARNKWLNKTWCFAHISTSSNILIPCTVQVERPC